MPVERLVSDPLVQHGKFKITPVPEGGESLMMDKRIFNCRPPLYAVVRVLGDGVKLTTQVWSSVGRGVGGAGGPGGSIRLIEPHTDHTDMVDYSFTIALNVNNRKPRQIKGQNESGKQVIYRFVSDRMSPLQKIARAFHR